MTTAKFFLAAVKFLAGLYIATMAATALTLTVTGQILTMQDRRASESSFGEFATDGVRCFTWRQQLSCIPDSSARSGAARAGALPQVEPATPKGVNL